LSAEASLAKAQESRQKLLASSPALFGLVPKASGMAMNFT